MIIPVSKYFLFSGMFTGVGYTTRSKLNSAKKRQSRVIHFAITSIKLNYIFLGNGLDVQQIF